jgi:hypothetical protein
MNVMLIITVVASIVTSKRVSIEQLVMRARDYPPPPNNYIIYYIVHKMTTVTINSNIPQNQINKLTIKDM